MYEDTVCTATYEMPRGRDGRGKEMKQMKQFFVIHRDSSLRKQSKIRSACLLYI